MNSFVRKIARFLADEDGPTAVEYATMMLLILLACLTTISLVGQSASTSFQESNDSIQDAIDPSG